MIAILLALLFAAFCPSACSEAAPAVSARACVLMCGDGSCLFEQEADARCLIASTTKLMTALVCLENAAPDDTVEALERHCTVEGSSMYLQAGERYTVRELLLGLLLASGNDAALALAEHTAGGEAAFVRLMNEKAGELGLTNTHFENPHGLDGEDHVSSARDLARLMLRCMENPAFPALDAARSAEVHGLTLINHNKLLELCPGCLGGKTGYTRAAGRCLVSCCERDGMCLVCVTLNDPDDWNDHMRLYDWAYENYALRDLSRELSFEIPVVSGSRTAVRAVPVPGAKAVLPRHENAALSAELPRFVFAPLDAGETAGSATVFRDGKELATIPLIYAESVSLADPCFAEENRND